MLYYKNLKPVVSLMKRFKKILLKSTIVLFISASVTILWWRGWIYSGYWGPPPIYNTLFSLDGESSYDAMMLQMFIISIVLTFPLIS